MKKIVKRLFVTFAIFLFNLGFIHAQYSSLTITQCQTEEEVITLVDSILLGNIEPVFKQNITFSGDPAAVGYYTGGSILGQVSDEGIVLSTGYAGELDKTNNCAAQNASGNTTGAGDPDLMQASGFTINDACIIEFDLMLFNDSVFLSYNFGSEEYNDYVGSFNDVFVFLLSGPGIEGPYSNNSKNIAVVPGTDNPVTINNLNCGYHAAGCDEPLPGGPNCELLVNNTFTSNSGFEQVALDAYTTPLKTEQPILSYQWYHFKLAIGDAVDAYWDSGVFLEKGSIVSIPVPEFYVVENETESEVISFVDSVLLSNVFEGNKANISFVGDPRAIGYFYNTDFLNLANNNGLLMTSGLSGEVDKSNECYSSANLSFNNEGLIGDTDLELLAGNSDVDDISIIEFDYRPSTDSIRFNYVFASEEYHEKINTEIHDAFGIFLSGPEIEGEYSDNAINLAVLPGSSEPVNSESINFGPGDLTCEGKPDGCTNCDYLIDNSQKPDSAFFALAYDAYTVPMYAVYNVLPGEWYHIKIAIGDQLTESFDSGIFLSGGTLISDSITTTVENKQTNGIRIKPNPAHNYIEIQELNAFRIHNYTIYDINGRLLIKAKFKSKKIPLSEFPEGILILELNTDHGISRYRLIHQ